MLATSAITVNIANPVKRPAVPPNNAMRQSRDSGPTFPSCVMAFDREAAGRVCESADVRIISFVLSYSAVVWKKRNRQKTNANGLTKVSSGYAHHRLMPRFLASPNIDTIQAK